jgi:hypothetical protein
MSNRLIALLALTIGIGGLWATRSHADYFSSWVATTCDSSSGVAVVRFGYADAEDPPLFGSQADPSIDHSISTIPVTNASQREASCKLNTGREVKVRLGLGYGEGDQFSVWVDGIRIAHSVIGEDFLPFELVVRPQGFKFCMFELPTGDWVYDVTSAGQKPVPIKCARSLTPINGAKDVAEYPVNGAAGIMPGSITVSRGHREFCRRLILKTPPNEAAHNFVGVPNRKENVSEANVDWSGPMYFPRTDSQPGTGYYIVSALFDFWKAGSPIRIYKFSSLGTFTDEFLMVPGTDTSEKEVMQMAESADDISIAEQSTRKKGWHVYSSADTPYGESTSVNIRLGRIDDQTYLFFSQSRGDGNPEVVLLKPQREAGSPTVACLFNRTHAHF